jgi:hypothetical protein
MTTAIQKSNIVHHVPVVAQIPSSMSQRLKAVLIRFFEAVRNFFSTILNALFPSRVKVLAPTAPAPAKIASQTPPPSLSEATVTPAAVVKITEPVLLPAAKVETVALEILPPAAPKKPTYILETHEDAYGTFGPALTQLKELSPDAAFAPALGPIDQLRQKEFEFDQLQNLSRRITMSELSPRAYVKVLEKYAPSECQEIFHKYSKSFSLMGLFRRAPGEDNQATEESCAKGKAALENDYYYFPRAKPYAQAAVESAIKEQISELSQLRFGFSERGSSYVPAGVVISEQAVSLV